MSVSIHDIVSDVYLAELCGSYIMLAGSSDIDIKTFVTLNKFLALLSLPAIENNVPTLPFNNENLQFAHSPEHRSPAYKVLSTFEICHVKTKNGVNSVTNDRLDLLEIKNKLLDSSIFDECIAKLFPECIPSENEKNNLYAVVEISRTIGLTM